MVKITLKRLYSQKCRHLSLFFTYYNNINLNIPNFLDGCLKKRTVFSHEIE